MGCGQRHENGLGVRIQGFNEYESQFGEWPHMCAVLAEEPVAQDPGYAGEPQTVNLYQCGGSLIAPGVILTAAQRQWTQHHSLTALIPKRRQSTQLPSQTPHTRRPRPSTLPHSPMALTRNRRLRLKSLTPEKRTRKTQQQILLGR